MNCNELLKKILEEEKKQTEILQIIEKRLMPIDVKVTCNGHREKT